MKAAVILPTLADRDAVGNDSRAMAQLLRRRGIDTRLFCDAAVDINERTYPAEQAIQFADRPCDLLIYHFSTAWPKGLQILQRSRAKKVLRYHNITPPQYFSGVSRIHEKACMAGRAEIGAVAQANCALYLGASQYNLDELIAAGAPADRCSVLPPFHRISQLLDAQADLTLLDQLNDGTPTALMVGRVAPNKGHLELVDAFAAWLDGYGHSARLLLVGKRDPALAGYVDRIDSSIHARGLHAHVCWLENINTAKLKAAYLASSMFLMLSEHEGFCVPLVEAMALGVPVLARGTSAIPETVADAGLVWDGKEPELYAASAERLMQDDALRAQLRSRGWQRYHQHFGNNVLEQRFADALERLA